MNLFTTGTCLACNRPFLYQTTIRLLLREEKNIKKNKKISDLKLDPCCENVLLTDQSFDNCNPLDELRQSITFAERLVRAAQTRRTRDIVSAP